MRARAVVCLGHATARVAALAAVVGLALMPLAVANAIAADPSPSSPIVFARPQYLVFWESHSTYNGPVTDNTYALFTDPPVEPPDHFVVPDGSGGVFHYRGRLEGGPYRTDVELCPQMIALDIPSLEAWPPSIVGRQVVVDCAAYRAAASALPAASSSPAPSTSGVSPAGGSGLTGGDIARVGGAAGGLLLAGAGAAGLVRGRRPRRDRQPAEQPGDPPAEAPDPCASQELEFHTQMARAGALSDLLQTNRAMQAVIDRQIVNLANVIIPGSFGLDVAFVLSGQWFSKVGWGFIPKELMARALEGAIKDVVKEAMKQGLDAAGQKALDLDQFHAKLLDGAGKAGLGGDKALLKQLFKDAVMSSQTSKTFATASNSAAQLNARLEIVKKFSEDTCGPLADMLGHALSMYNAGIGVAELRERLDILRIKRDTVLDQTATLEVELQDMLEHANNARDRLNHCRYVNSPEWRP